MVASTSSSLTQYAYEQVRADLLAGRLRPGARLHINELCQKLQVSLSAVREALSRLTAEDLVIAEPQRGFRAAPISAAELQDLMQARVQIEGTCLEHAIRSGDVAWEAQLVAAFHHLSRTPEREPGDPDRMNEAWSAAHDAFHQALVAGCRNVWLLRLRRLLYAQSERYRRLSVPLGGGRRNLQREHKQIMTAALARDAAAATALLGRHLEKTTELLLRQSWPESAAGAPEASVKRRVSLRAPRVGSAGPGAPRGAPARR